jgi:hypothetical protein
MRQRRRTDGLSAVKMLFGAGLVLAAGGCTGVLSSEGGSNPAADCMDTGCLGGPAGGGGVGAPGSAGGPSSTLGGPGEAPMRRLNNAEYAHTVRDLFASSALDVVFPSEGRTEGYDTLSTALAISPIHIDAYLEAAGQVIAELFTTDPAGIKAGFCTYASPDAEANLTCARKIIADFAARAWRRPLATWKDANPETEYAAVLLPTSALASLPLEQRLRAALEAVLVSPRFLFRVELAGADGKLDGPSLAARLSYFLWSSAPDGELLESELMADAGLGASVARMQADPRFERFLQRFPDMWLELEKLEGIERDPQVYPAFAPDLIDAMRAETQAFFTSYWESPASTIRGFLLAPVAKPSNATLAALYGDSPRLGIITQASIMTLTGATNRTSPVRRGKWVLERLMCDPPPPPPDSLIAELAGDLAADTTLTERERLALHRVNPVCSACHVAMDPVGLGLENYDSLGAYRTLEATGEPVDATGTLPDGSTFDGALELVDLLAKDSRLQACVAQQLLTYGTGRSYNGNDAGLLAQLRASAGGSEASFKTVLNHVVLSDAFRRRAEAK